MKKLVVLLTICALTICLVSCSGSNSNNNETEPAQEKTEEVEETPKIEQDIWTITSEETTELKEYTEFQFDDNGNVISKKEGHPVTWTYEYDENGLLTKETSTHTLYGFDEITYEYDENGLVIHESEKSDYSIRDGVAFTTNYEFDDKGNVIRMSITSNSSDEPTIINFKYDDNGKIITKTETGDDYSSETKYAYNEDGNVSTTYTEFSDGSEPMTMHYTYEKTGTRTYDADNIPIAEKYRYFRENWNK